MVVVTLKNVPIIPIVLNTKDVRITKIIVDTENAPMTTAVITNTSIIKGIGMTITAIGGLGSNGINTQKYTQTYPNMEHITAKIHI